MERFTEKPIRYITLFCMAIFSVIMAGSVVFAQDLDLTWREYCVNSTDLFRETNYYNGSDLSSFNQTIYCDTGCSISLNACKPNDLGMIIWMVGGVVGIIFLFIIGYKLPYEFGFPMLMINLFIIAFLYNTDIFIEMYDLILIILFLLDILLLLKRTGEFWSEEQDKNEGIGRDNYDE